MWNEDAYARFNAEYSTLLVEAMTACGGSMHQSFDWIE
jgi:hypothetical protein